MAIVTISERKNREANRKARAIGEVIAELRDYVRSTKGGGRFIVFGSAASGAIRHGSDFDVLVDFPEGNEPEAWAKVEDACRKWNLRADILSVRTTDPVFVAKMMSRPVEVIE